MNESIILKKFLESKGETFEKAAEELEKRKKILEWMSSQGIKDYIEVTRYINMYYKEPKKLIELSKKESAIIRPSGEQEREKISVKERLKKRISMLDLLGIKLKKKKK